jgi:hypothetical protein
MYGVPGIFAQTSLGGEGKPPLSLDNTYHRCPLFSLSFILLSLTLYLEKQKNDI